MGGGTRGRGRTGEEEGPISKEVVARAGSGSKVCEEAVAADNEIGLASISPHTVTWSTCTQVQNGKTVWNCMEYFRTVSYVSP